MEHVISFIKRWLTRMSYDLGDEKGGVRLGEKSIEALEARIRDWKLFEKTEEGVKRVAFLEEVEIEPEIFEWLQALSDSDRKKPELSPSKKAVAFIQLLCQYRKIVQVGVIDGRLGPRTQEAFAALQAFEETVVELVQKRLRERYYDLGKETEQHQLGERTKRAIEEETRVEETINPLFELELKVVAFVQLLCRRYGFPEVGGIDGSLGPKTREALEGLKRRMEFGPRIGLALSGGGFRASIFHLGVIRRLEELGIMPHVNVISSVSGGSIIAAFYAIEMERRLRARLARLARIEYLDVPSVELKLMEEDDVDKIPDKGTNLVVVASVSEQLHFRIFDPEGEKVRDTSETQLSHRQPEVKSLKRTLEEMRNRVDAEAEPGESETDEEKAIREEAEKTAIVNAVKSILTGNVDRKILREQRLEVFDEIARQFFKATNRNLRTRAMVFWPFYNPLALFKIFRRDYTRANRIQEEYDKCLYGGNTLDELPHVGADPGDPTYGPKLVLNTTSLLTGKRIPFSREPMSGMGQLSTVNTNVLGLSRIVGASAGVPGLFPPTPVGGDLLVDGGVSDNQGLEGLWQENCDVLLVSDASGQMEQVHKLKSKALAVVKRTNAIFQFQIRQQLLRRLQKWLLAAPPEWEREFSFVHLFLSLKDRPADPQVPSEFVPSLGRIRTDLDQFNYVERESLMYHGYTLIDSQLKSHCPRLLKRIIEGEGLDSRDMTPTVPMLFDEALAVKKSEDRWASRKAGDKVNDEEETDTAEEREVRWISERRGEVKATLEAGSQSILIMRSIKRDGRKAVAVLAVVWLLLFGLIFSVWKPLQTCIFKLTTIAAEHLQAIVPEQLMTWLGEYLNWPITLRGFTAIILLSILIYLLLFLSFVAIRWLSEIWSRKVYRDLTGDKPENAWKRTISPGAKTDESAR